MAASAGHNSQRGGRIKLHNSINGFNPWQIEKLEDGWDPCYLNRT